MDFEVIANTAPTLLQLFGRLHPMLVHFPIATLLVLIFYEVATKLGYRAFERGLPWHGLVALASFVPAMITGTVNYLCIDSDVDFREEAFVHGYLMIAAFVVLAASLTHRTRSGATRWYMIGLAVAAAIMSVGAHMGAMLVYGHDYFG